MRGSAKGQGDSKDDLGGIEANKTKEDQQGIKIIYRMRTECTTFSNEVMMVGDLPVLRIVIFKSISGH